VLQCATQRLLRACGRARLSFSINPKPILPTRSSGRASEKHHLDGAPPGNGKFRDARDGVDASERKSGDQQCVVEQLHSTLMIVACFDALATYVRSRCNTFG
jgi:hypothetical protein